MFCIPLFIITSVFDVPCSIFGVYFAVALLVVHQVRTGVQGFVVQIHHIHHAAATNLHLLHLAGEFPDPFASEKTPPQPSSRWRGTSSARGGSVQRTVEQPVEIS